MTNRRFTTIVLGLALVGGLLVIGGGATLAQVTQDDGNTGTGATVAFNEQESSGTTVTIASITLPADGFITLYSGNWSAENPASNTIIGMSDSLSAGTYQNVEVKLFDVPNRSFSANRVVHEEELVTAVLNSDENRTYEFVISDETADQSSTDKRSIITSSAVNADDPSTETVRTAAPMTTTGSRDDGGDEADMVINGTWPPTNDSSGN